MYVVVDFEATCKQDDRDFKMEIIEIGAVAFHPAKTHHWLAYQAFVQPVLNPELTDFCKKLTTIKQSDVDNADQFFLELPRWKQWIKFCEELFNERAIFCSWGAYDRKQLAKDCMLHELDYPFTGEHINIKTNFQAFTKPKFGAGMAGAAQHYGIPIIGTQHRGIDDAMTITHIFQTMLNKGLSPYIQKG